jgi:putative transposase
LRLSGRVPPRVDAATKAGLLALLEDAVDQGWTVRAACASLELGQRRAWRWLDRRDSDQLADLRAGGGAVHRLLDSEVAEIVALFHQWGEVDRSHRKLAHRGSYLHRVWVSPSSVRRVLDAEGLRLRPLPRPSRSVRQPFPDWVEYRPGMLWIFDTTHFTRAGAAVCAIEDLVSRKWLGEVVSVEETSVQVQAAFCQALEAEGLMDQVAARLDGTVDLACDDPGRPILLAMSDNAPADDLGIHPGVHGVVRHPPALRPPWHPHRPGLDLGRCSAMSRPSGRT